MVIFRNLSMVSLLFSEIILLWVLNVTEILESLISNKKELNLKTRYQLAAVKAGHAVKGNGDQYPPFLVSLLLPPDSCLPTGALWMPLGDLGRALRTDYPVPGRPHTFSLPTIYQVLCCTVLYCTILYLFYGIVLYCTDYPAPRHF